MITRIAALISSGLGSGYARVAPGTCGTVAAVAGWVLLSLSGVFDEWSGRAAAAVGIVVLGTFAAKASLDDEGGEDPQWIVIDEWAGVWIALIAADPSNVYHIIAAFVGFRFFDILKPGPVGLAEDLPDEFGIMGDDIVAGFLALAGLLVVRWL